MSASHKGHPTSAETRAKLSASHKGKPLTPAQLAGVRAQGLRRRGVSLPEATRAKISAALSGRKRSAEHCRRISESKMGHTVSEATRRKISETKRAAATTARGARNAKARAVVCMETGERFDTVTEAAQSITRSPENLSSCCRGQRKTCGGYHWKYDKEEADHVDR